MPIRLLFPRNQILHLALQNKKYVPEPNGFFDFFKSKCDVQETSETENVETKYQNFLDILFPNATR